MTAKHLELHFIRLTLEPYNIPFDEEAHSKEVSWRELQNNLRLDRTG